MEAKPISIRKNRRGKPRRSTSEAGVGFLLLLPTQLGSNASLLDCPVLTVTGAGILGPLLTVLALYSVAWWVLGFLAFDKGFTLQYRITLD